MKKLHEIARQRIQIQLESVINTQFSLHTEYPKITERPNIELPEVQQLDESNNTLNRLLDQSVDKLSQISSIRSSGKSRISMKQQLEEKKPSFEKITLPKRSYKEASRDQISRLKQRRKQLDNTPIQVSVESRIEIDRIWEEVQAENDAFKKSSEELLHLSACRALQNKITLLILKTAFQDILKCSRIRFHILQRQNQFKRKIFDNWWFITEDKRQMSRRLLVMKQRIKDSDNLRKIFEKDHEK